jgi:hypothetical protein
LYAVSWELNGFGDPPSADDARLAVKVLPRTEDHILARITLGYLTNDARDIKAVVVAEDSGGKFDANGSGFRAAISGSALVKRSDSASVLLAKSIVQSVTAQGYSPYKVMQAKKTGVDGSVARTFALEPATSYYYEYDARGPGEAGDVSSAPLKIEYETATSGNPASGKLYASKSYIEDFNYDGTSATDFFRFDNKAYIKNGAYMGADFSVGASNRVGISAGSWAALAFGEIKFTVPAGKTAALSFDYSLHSPYSWGYNWGSYTAGTPRVELNGTAVVASPISVSGSGSSADYSWGTATGHYTHGEALGPGAYTLSARTMSGSYSYNTSKYTLSGASAIDNLSVVLLENTPVGNIQSSDAASSASDGFVRHSGSFTTPDPVISYDFPGFAENETFGGNTVFSFLGGTADEWALRNLSIYRTEDGVKVYAVQNVTDTAAQVAQWRPSGVNLALIDERPAGEEEERNALIYKKGELVVYNIGYTDYENDPSGASFWRYTHTPFNDGAHPDAAVIKNLKNEVASIADKTLSASIERFYIDGKYTVEHWQRDSTNRTGDASGFIDYNDFDKYSNTEALTFYIEGGGEAPWVTSVATNPSPVIEGAGYKIVAEVDDLEKDTLTVVIEVYLDGEEVYRYYEDGIEADADGHYPPVVTGIAPGATPGDYTVVVTVSDRDGAGLGSHRFTVLVEGRIEGAVYHTEQWERNRKSYNTKLFGDAYTAASVFADYKDLTAPRKRGVNVFWSGERFMLQAAVGGNPTGVTCQIAGYPAYTTAMSATGTENADGDAVYGGSLWESSMINRWGKASPAELTFIFTANYEGDIVKTHEATVIVDTFEDYWQLHRNF